MKSCALMSVLSLLVSLLLPVTVPHAAAEPFVGSASAGILHTAGTASADAAPANAAPDTDAPEAAASAADGSARYGSDALTTVLVLRGGTAEAFSLSEYLPGVVAGEMPASFEPDALRAQAVAARSYALAHIEAPPAAHPQYALCDEPGCCEVYLTEEERRERWGAQYALWEERIEEAVRDTDGVYLVYDGEPITACFHASSAGYTETGAAVWGNSVPYLVSVSSPETADDVPNFVTTAEFSPEEFRERILAAFPEAGLSALPPDWLGERTVDPSGRVSSVRIGSAVIPGTEMRSLFSLRSANFTLVWTGRSFLFTVAGSGHGAGMSQYGANVMAKQGAAWQDILTHYYPGASLTLP